MFVRLSFFFFRSRDNSLTCNLGHSACPLFWIFPACFHTHISILHLNLLTFLFYAPCLYFLYLNEIGKQFIKLIIQKRPEQRTLYWQWRNTARVLVETSKAHPSAVTWFTRASPVPAPWTEFCTETACAFSQLS